MQTPPFRADHVGSLLRPAALKEAREKRARGQIDAAALKAVEDREIEKIISKQEAVGLKSVTDGEFRRSWWHLDFLWELDGTERHVMDQGIAFAGVQTRPEGVRVVGKLGFSGHPMLEHFKFVQARTKQTPKMTIPAPSAMYGRVGRGPISQTVYPRLDEFFADLGAAYRKAVRAFADAGCRYLQLDEVFIAMLCDPAYRRKQQAQGDDPQRLAELYGDLIKVDGYFMEYDSERAGGFEPLRLVPKGRKVVLGLVTTKTGALEAKDAIKRRIEQAGKFVDVSQLCLSPQCGFASVEEGNVLAEDEQWAKLAMVVDIANEVWGE
jgi:5-methyltetrahydropteroyltriglutamate--homocysteine methyltransferase